MNRMLRPFISTLRSVQLRHPNVLQFKDTAEVEVRHETIIYLVTEAVTPLYDHLQHLDIQVPHSISPELTSIW